MKPTRKPITRDEFMGNLTDGYWERVEFRMDTLEQEEIEFVGVTGPGAVGRGLLTVMFRLKGKGRGR